MFTKITRTNSHNEELETVINTDYIVRITDYHKEPTKLFDESGEVVETREPQVKYVVELKGGYKCYVDQANYDKLVELLVK